LADYVCLSGPVLQREVVFGAVEGERAAESVNAGGGILLLLQWIAVMETAVTSDDQRLGRLSKKEGRVVTMATMARRSPGGQFEPLARSVSSRSRAAQGKTAAAGPSR